MDNPLTPEQQNNLMEQTLREIPLAPLPRDMTASVMMRIQKEVRPSLFTWNDFVLSLVIALSIGALFFAIQAFPPIIVTKIRIQSILLYQAFLVNARWLVPSILFGLGAFFSALTLPYLRNQLKS
ncbi:MAG: hypothetical protein U0Z26_17960 [Anaerolineales bacterium]